MGDGFRGVPREEKVAAVAEETFAIVPGSGDERYAARHGFKRTNRRNAGQRVRVRPPRDVDGYAVLRKDGGHVVVREPAAVFDTGLSQFLEGFARIAHTVDTGLEAERLDGTDEEFAQFFRSFAIAPIADPHDISGFGQIERPEDSGVCRFVPRPCRPGPAPVEINIPD